MIRRILLPGLIIGMMAWTSCVKDTYEMKMLSKKAKLSPSLAMSVVKGNLTLGDMVKANDTVVIGQDKFIRIVFREDSVVNFKMADMYDLNDMLSFSRAYKIGEVNLNPFSTVQNFTLRQIANSLAEPGRTTLLNLHNTNNVFPSFPSVNLAETVFPLITNLEYATLSAGSIEFSVKNNMGAPLSGFSISLYNTSGHVLIGSASSASVIPSGTTGIATIDLANKTVRNSITAAITLGGSTGNATPSLINLDTRGIEMTIGGKNLTIKSGKVILPSQTITAQNSTDSMMLDPGQGIELDEIKLIKGNINYSIISPFTVSGSLNVTLPAALRNGVVVNNTIPINGTLTNGVVSVDNTIFDLGTDPAQPFNEIPIIYSFQISSSGSMVVFNSTDAITVNLELPQPEFDYVKGYFGSQTEAIGPEVMDLDITDVLGHITGDFLVASPSIKLNYSNSFSVPIRIDLNATAKRGTKTVELGLDTINLNFPQYPARDISSSFIIDKNNSALPQLISLPPEEITFSGTAITNKAGTANRDNYVYGDSRFIGSLEVEVPMEFKFTNFQFADTVDNFMIDNSNNGDNPINPENFNLLRLNIDAVNGFPLGISMSLSLYNPTTKTILRTIDATDLLKPAAVDATGKVTSPAESKTTIEFTKAFFGDINKADQIIFKFRLNTTGTNAVKFYSDYKIKFNAALVWKPDININLN